MTAMNGSLHSDLAVAGLFAVLLAAMHFDFLHHRIPNALSALGLSGALLLAALAAGWPGVGRALAGAGVGLAMLLPFHALRGMGAGDVKLMAAVGAFLGPAATVVAAGVTLVTGAAIAILVVIRARPDAADRVEAMLAEADAAEPTEAPPARRLRFPYAVAIAVGSAAAAIMRPLALAGG